MSILLFYFFNLISFKFLIIFHYIFLQFTFPYHLFHCIMISISSVYFICFISFFYFILYKHFNHHLSLKNFLKLYLLFTSIAIHTTRVVFVISHWTITYFVAQLCFIDTNITSSTFECSWLSAWECHSVAWENGRF